MKIDRNSRITLNFELKTKEGGHVIDSNFGEPAVNFVFGDGSMLPGFEEHLLSLRAGDEKEFVIHSEKAFGDVRSDNQHWFMMNRFSDLELSVGLMIDFSGNEQAAVTGVVADIDEARVLIDFNHPLAGKDILFKVRIVDVQANGDGVIHTTPIDS